MNNGEITSTALTETPVLSTTNLYVCGLPLMYQGEQLKELFSEFGPISETRVLNNTVLVESKGIGFVHFFDSVDAKNAVEKMNNRIIWEGEGPLVVKFARDVRKSMRKRDEFWPIRMAEPLNRVYKNSPSNVFCKFFFTTGRCMRGTECNFSHGDSPVPGQRSNLLNSLKTWGLLDTYHLNQSEDDLVRLNAENSGRLPSEISSQKSVPLESSWAVSTRPSPFVPQITTRQSLSLPQTTQDNPSPAPANNLFPIAPLPFKPEFPTGSPFKPAWNGFSATKENDYELQAAPPLKFNLNLPSEPTDSLQTSEHLNLPPQIDYLAERNGHSNLHAGDQQNGWTTPSNSEPKWPSRAKKTESQLLGISKTNLYVSQFPREWTSASLEERFARFGAIDKIRILTPSNADKNRGVGFVHFKTSESALNALTAMQSYTPPNCSKPIIVKFANQGGKATRNIIIPPGACRYWIKGDCSRGSLCCFRHDPPAETLSDSVEGDKGRQSKRRDGSFRQSRSEERCAEAVKDYRGPLDVNGEMFRGLLQAQDGPLEAETFSAGRDSYDVSSEEENDYNESYGTGGVDSVYSEWKNGLDEDCLRDSGRDSESSGEESDASVASTPNSLGVMTSAQRKAKELMDQRQGGVTKGLKAGISFSLPLSDDEVVTRREVKPKTRREKEFPADVEQLNERRWRIEEQLIAQLEKPFCFYIRSWRERMVPMVEGEELDAKLLRMFNNSIQSGRLVECRPEVSNDENFSGNY